jgi:hypothetical protein
MRDKVAKSRTHCPSGKQHGSKTHPESILRGSQNPSAKLTEEQVHEIRLRAALSDLDTHVLSVTYGVSITAIRDAARGKTWKHVV